MILREKISFPPPRASMKQLYASPGWGPTRSFAWNVWPGFPQPCLARVVGINRPLLRREKEIFSRQAESPKLRRRRAVAKPIGKMGEQARRVRPTQTVVYRHPAVGKQTVYFHFKRMQLKNQTSLFSLSAETSVGRTSAEGGDSAWGNQILPRGQG